MSVIFPAIFLNSSAVAAAAVGAGYLGADDDPSYVEAVVGLIRQAAEPALHAGAYDFGNTDLANRMSERVLKLRVEQLTADELTSHAVGLRDRVSGGEDLDVLLPEAFATVREAGKRVLVVEDGPTLTHGGMSRGAGWFAAREAGAAPCGRLCPKSREASMGTRLMATVSEQMSENMITYPNSLKRIPETP